MDRLPHRHLTTPTLAGRRFEGERLTGRVVGGHDWFVRRADATPAIDVRLTLATDDRAAVGLLYRGQMLAAPDAMARFRRGEVLASDEYRLEVTARFECGVPAYAWLNDVIAVGVGEQTATGPVYHFFEIGGDRW